MGLVLKGGLILLMENKHMSINYDYNIKFIRMLSEREMIFKKYAYKCKMYEAEHWLLCTIYMGTLRGEEYTQKECSDLWAFPKQTINSATKKLINRNLVYLELSNDDKRKKVIHLTEWGIKVAKEIMPPLLNSEESAFDALDDEEKELFLSCLEKICNKLKSNIDYLYKENKVDFEILNKGDKYEI